MVETHQTKRRKDTATIIYIEEIATEGGVKEDQEMNTKLEEMEDGS